MAIEFATKQRDTYRPIKVIATQSNGLPLNLTSATVTFWMRKVGTIDAEDVVIDGNGVNVTDPLRGKMQYEWASEELADLGHYEAEFRVTFEGGKRLTLPQDGYIIISVTDDVEAG